jgi:hypothetical protein
MSFSYVYTSTSGRSRRARDLTQEDFFNYEESEMIAQEELMTMIAEQAEQRRKKAGKYPDGSKKEGKSQTKSLTSLGGTMVDLDAILEGKRGHDQEEYSSESQSVYEGLNLARQPPSQENAAVSTTQTEDDDRFYYTYYGLDDDETGVSTFKAIDGVHGLDNDPLNNKNNSTSNINNVLVVDDDVISTTAIPINPFDFIRLPPDYDSSIMPMSEFTIVVQCGDGMGNTNDSNRICVVTGGESHFFVKLKPTGTITSDENAQVALLLSLSSISVQFIGITMRDAKDTSVLVYHDLSPVLAASGDTASVNIPSMAVKFTSCVFRENAGSFGGAMNIYEVPSTSSSSSSTEVTTGKVDITIESCVFLANESQNGAIFVEREPSADAMISVSVSVLSSLFQSNMGGGAIQSSIEVDDDIDGILLFDNLELDLQDSCFVNNGNTQRPGTVSLDIYSESLLRNINNYGVDNSAIDPSGFSVDDDYYQNIIDDGPSSSSNTACLDIYTNVVVGDSPDTPIEYCLSFEASAEVPACRLLQKVPTSSPTTSFVPTMSPTAPFCSDGTTRGYDSWVALGDAIESGHNGQTFVLCPNTLFDPNDFSTDDIIIVPDTAIIVDDILDLTIQCGTSGTLDQNCTIQSGESHFWLRGDVGDITFNGIRFEQADQTSILAYASSSSTATFTDCVWSNNEGQFGSGVNIWSDLLRERMTVVIIGCEFVNNTSIEGTLVVEGGTLEVESCIFLGTIDGAIYVEDGGRLSLLRGNCFDSNVITSAVVTLSSSSLLGVAENNFGINNTVAPGDSSECLDISVGDECQDFDAEQCAVDAPTAAPTVSPAPSLSPAPTSNFCYDDYATLKNAVETGEQAVSNGGMEIYRICRQTTLSLPPEDAGITINRSFVQLACDGTCTFEGGVAQIVIDSTGTTPVTDIEVRGITFTGATQGAVRAGARSGSDATFRNCRFQDVKGSSLATLLLRNVQGLGMELNVEQCVFGDNRAGIAIVQNIGGRLIVSDTTFNDNVVGNVIAVSGGGSLSLANSCFRDNSQQPGLGGFGLLYIQASGELVANTDNFGSNNVLFPPTGDSCDIYIEEDDVCEVFTANECLASTV